MSDADGVADAPGRSDTLGEGEDDAGIALGSLARQLGPIRRAVAFAVESGGAARFLEINLRRWLDPLLAEDLPGPLRDALMRIAGQLAGVDALEVQVRLQRLRTVRHELARLDALLGLDTVRPPRPRARARLIDVQAADAAPDATPSRPGAEDPPPAEADGQRRSRRKRRRRGGGRDEPDTSESNAPATAAERPREPAPRRRSWGGNLFQPLAELEVEPAALAALAAAGIHTVSDLLHIRPREEEVLRPIRGAGRALPEGRVAVGGRLAGLHRVLRPGGHERRGTLRGAGRLALVWNDEALAEDVAGTVEVGERVVLVGTWDGMCLRDPEYAIEDAKSVRLPRYGLDGVPDAVVQRLLYRLIGGLAEARDPLPQAASAGLPAHGAALLALHQRGDSEAGRARLAFDELLAVQLIGAQARFQGRAARGLANAPLHGRAGVVQQSFDLRLSDDAEQVFDDIKRDLRQARPMRRVLGGGPGAGRGLVAALTAAMVAEGKSQVLWVTPTGRAAEAQYVFTGRMLERAGLTARLLRPGKRPDAALRASLKRGDVSVLFASLSDLQSLPGDALAFRRLGLIVACEHPERGGFGGSHALAESFGSPSPDLLVLPLVRPGLTELLDVWAAYDLSVLDGPSPPEVVIKRASQPDAAFAASRHTLQDGGQVAILFPQRDGDGRLGPAEAERHIAQLSSRHLGGRQIGLLHDEAPYGAWIDALDDLSHRRIDVLYSTLPLEDLPPVPGLRTVVVEDAHRADLTRLQRIARMGVDQLALIVDEDLPAERVQQLVQAVRSERPVEMPTTPRFAFFDPTRDRAALFEARRRAFRLLAEDGELRAGSNADLVRLIRARWAVWFGDRTCPLDQPPASSAPESPPSAGGRKRRRRRRRR